MISHNISFFLIMGPHIIYTREIGCPDNEISTCKWNRFCHITKCRFKFLTGKKLVKITPANNKQGLEAGVSPLFFNTSSRFMDVNSVKIACKLSLKMF